MFRKKVSRPCILAMFLIGCTQQTATQVDAFTATTCPNDLPSSCPSTIPSWKATVQPIVEAQCTVCHTAGGQDATRPFDTYAQLTQQPGAVLDQIYACTMPPTDNPMPDSTERQALLAWLVCGAPDN